MSLVTDMLVGFLSLYLAFTNSIADGINSLIEPESPATVTTAEPISPQPKLTDITSNYERGGSIPDILIKNAAYQQAAVSQAILPEATASAAEALVNIFCTYTNSEYERTTTGTGFFIHPDGIILTNAHVAQFLILAGLNGDSECVIRTGNPATPTYTADLLYISPLWLRENAGLFNEAEPKGTGERDYALLYVNSALEGAPMPRVFPALSFDTELLRTNTKDTTVTAAGYPAANLQTEGENATLVQQIATTTVTELMTFGSNYADLFSIAGSAVGASGSSGGPVVDETGNVIGMIVTRGDDEQFGNGSLRAITLSYIDRTITEETSMNLLKNLSGNLPYRAKLYKTAMIPFLEQIMQWELAE